MCRWFAYLSHTEECLLEDVLEHGIAKQVHDHYLPNLLSHLPSQETTHLEISLRNRLNNVDGFGLAWYTPARSSFILATDGARPTLYKFANPPTNDANFHSICANTSTLALFVHIRAATATAVTSTNNHPFAFGRHVIMHNGIVAHFSDIRRPLLNLLEKSCYENVHGTTDSEHFAALLMTYLTQASPGPGAWERAYPAEQLADALLAAVETVIGLQRDTLGAPNVQASSLNICVSDGTRLVALRYRNHASEQPPSLYFSRSAGVTLNRKYPDTCEGADNPDACRAAREHGAHVIVASEPSTYKKDEWTLIEKNQMLVVDEGGKVAVRDVTVREDLLACAATGRHF